MYGTSRSILSANSSPAQRANESIAYLSKCWFPVNPSTLEAIQTKVDQDFYANDPALLIGDLARDLSLFGYCLKSAKQFFPDNKAKDPLTTLSELKRPALLKMLDVPETKISAHRLSKSDEAQLSALRLSVTGCITTMVMVEKTSLSPRLALVGSLLRHLGILLSAWNYPRAYALGAASVRAGKSDMDSEIKRIVGLSRFAIASRMATEWQVFHQVRDALARHDTVRAEEGSLSLGRICELGEALAALFHNLDAAKNSQSIDRLKRELKDLFGPNAYERIVKESGERVDAYFAAAPKVKTPPIQKIHTLPKECPRELQRPLLKLLAKTEAGRLSTEALESLERKVLPAAGFTTGFLFLLDEMSLKFHPVLKIGLEAPVRDPLDSSTHDSLREGIFSETPVQKQWVPSDGTKVSYVVSAAPFGEETAVLYLEAEKGFLTEGSHSHSDYFLGILEGVKRCLGWT